MGDPKQSQEWWQGIGKLLLYIVFVLIGVAVSIAMEAQQVIMSRKKVVLRVVFSICAGAISSFVCAGLKLNTAYSAVIVPCSTILGQEFFRWLVTGGWDAILSRLKAFLSKKKELE